MISALSIALCPLAVHADATYDNNTVTITETAEEAPNQRFTLRVYKPGVDPAGEITAQDLQYAAEAKANDDGSVVFSFQFDLPSDTYPYQLRSENGAVTVSDLLYYVNEADYRDAMAKLNTAIHSPEIQRPLELQKVLEAHVGTFQLTQKFEVYEQIKSLDNTVAYERLARLLTPDIPLAELQMMFQQSMVLSAVKNGSARLIQTILQENLRLFEIADEKVTQYLSQLTSAGMQAVAEDLRGNYYLEMAECAMGLAEAVALESFNHAENWQSLKTMLQDLKHSAGLNTSSFDTAAETVRNSAAQILIKKRPFISKGDFETKLASAVAEAGKSSSGSSSRPSGGSNGGGGFGGNGGAGVEVDQETLKDLYGDKAHNSVSFRDLDNVAWAQEAILSLAGRGVISGRGDGLFAPNEAVTREEFVKMLILALGFEASDADPGFSDTEAGAWYEPYVKAAAKWGIAEGDGDGTFGIGVPITRQDAAVMISRALELQDIELPDNETASFEDDGEIAAYAKEAVYLLARGGVIQGVGDNRFAPVQEITRAETAKMIYGIRG